MDYKFQINLRGIIDLLSNHLYSGPEVFLRELLQNGVDAIRARQSFDPTHCGEIAM
jgi:molecular chaperone HtpG